MLSQATRGRQRSTEVAVAPLTLRPWSLPRRCYIRRLQPCEAPWKRDIHEGHQRRQVPTDLGQDLGVIAVPLIFGQIRHTGGLRPELDQSGYVD